MPGFVLEEATDLSTQRCFLRDTFLVRCNNVFHMCVCSTNPATLHMERAVEKIPNTIAVQHNRSIHSSTKVKYRHTNHRNLFGLLAYHFRQDPCLCFAKPQMEKFRT